MTSCLPFIKDALYSYMAIPEFFQPLIDSVPLQRLRRVRQLAGTEYVYPGATHTRFEHSLGVMHLAGELCDILNINAEKEGKIPLISKQDKKSIMAAGLLHDIGHGPFSHVFEKLYEDQHKNHEDITNWLIKTVLEDTILSMDLDPRYLMQLATGNQTDSNTYFKSQIIAGTIDCDSLDYLVRDSYYTGAVVGSLDVQRIMLMTKVLDGNLAFDVKIGVPIIEGYFLFRLNSFKQIYFHKTSRSAQIMIYNALENKKDEFNLGVFDKPDDFLKWDDYTLWTTIQPDPFIQKLKKRQILKMVYESGNLESGKSNTQLTYKDIAKYEADIAAEAKVSEKDVFIDTPYLPTVPYAHATSFDPEDIPIFEIQDKGIIIQKLSELSVFFSLIKGYYNIVRVYTWEENRDKVGKVAKQILDNVL